MMMTPTNRIAPAVLLIMLLSGCGTTPPSHFYLLEAMPAESITPAVAGGHAGPHIGVGPVEFADYLVRAPIVTRTDGVEISLAETHRWAEPLDNNFSRVLAENLSLLLGTDRMSLHPSRNWSDIDYQVLVNVLQFDAEGSGGVTLAASWSIRGKAGSGLLAMRKSTFHAETAATASHADIVRALSDTVALLSREIAAAIQTLESP